MCRIQTFPEGIKFDCGRTDIQKMIGNAVPSLLAEVLARSIRVQFLQSKITSKPHLLPLKRSPVPKPETPTKVPKQYHTLIKQYEDHPGEKAQNKGIVKKIKRAA